MNNTQQPSPTPFQENYENGSTAGKRCGMFESKVIDCVWQKTKKKETLHSPTTQLWDFKESCHHSSCACSSSSNTTRYVCPVMQITIYYFCYLIHVIRETLFSY